MAPASFTTLKVRSRRPDTAEPRLQVMILVASFWAHCRRVMTRQPPRFGSGLISAGRELEQLPAIEVSDQARAPARTHGHPNTGRLSWQRLHAPPLFASPLDPVAPTS